MARIEGVYQRFLKTIPPHKITKLSPEESFEIDKKISDAFCKKAKSYKKQPSLIQKFFIGLFK